MSVQQRRGIGLALAACGVLVVAVALRRCWPDAALVLGGALLAAGSHLVGMADGMDLARGRARGTQPEGGR